MSLLRSLALLTVALAFLVSARAGDEPKKVDADEQSIAGTVVDVLKDGTIVIEVAPLKRGATGNLQKNVEVKTNNQTKFTKTNKDGGNQAQVQCQFSDVKKGDKVNVKTKKNNNNAASVNIFSSNPNTGTNLSTNPNKNINK